jgi:hypothetical protein
VAPGADGGGVALGVAPGCDRSLSNRVNAASTQERVDSRASQTTPRRVSPLRRKKRAPVPGRVASMRILGPRSSSQRSSLRRLGASRQSD